MYRAANESKVNQGRFYFIQSIHLVNIHASLICNVEDVAPVFS